MRTIERNGQTVTICSTKLVKGRHYEILAPRGTVWALADGTYALSQVAHTERDALTLARTLSFVPGSARTMPGPLAGV